MSTFVASDGWLWRFCRRHGIRQLSLQGEKLSADKSASDDFCKSFPLYVEENQLTLNQIFNCDETGLYYQLLPKTLAAHSEKRADGRKKAKQRVTINACSNASGTIKLPLLLIGKYKNPRCFKHINKDFLPVTYHNQANAWMNTSIFSDWFHHTFVPTVRLKLLELGVEPKAVLVLDNCSAHPNEDVLVSDDQKIVVKFLPPNVTSLIQPMDQEVLESLKRRYRRKLLEKLLLRDVEGRSIVDFIKSIDMLQVANLISRCWDEIPPSILRNSWRKSFAEPSCSEEGASTSVSAQDPEQQAMDTSSEMKVDEFRSAFQQLGFDLSEADTIGWLNYDEQDRGYAHLTDEEIITSVVQDTTSKELDCNESDEEVEAATRVSHAEAEKMFDQCIKWLQEQEEASHYNVRVLQELSELAARKRLNTLKQRKVSDYFNIVFSSTE